MAGVDLAMRATVQGFDKLTQLNAQLDKTRMVTKEINRSKGIAKKQSDLAINNLKEENNLIQAQNKGTLKSRLERGKLRNEQKELLKVRGKDNILMERAGKIQTETNAGNVRARNLAREQITVEEKRTAARKFSADQGAQIDAEFKKRKQEMAMLEREELARKKEITMAERIRRQELMQASIGMFVMGITMTQTLGVMEQMVGKGTALGNVFKEMGQGVRFMLGPIQVVTSAMQFMNMANRAMMLSMAKFMFIFAGAFILFKAFTAQGKKLRFVLGAVGGVLVTLNALLLINAARTWASTVATIVKKSVETFGTALPILALAVGGGLALGLAAMASAPKGQTTEGFIRPVRKTGLFYAHQGEGVGQIGAMAPSGGGGGDTYINVNVPQNTLVTTDMVDYMTSEIEIAVASGQV